MVARGRGHSDDGCEPPTFAIAGRSRSRRRHGSSLPAGRTKRDAVRALKRSSATASTSDRVRRSPLVYRVVQAGEVSEDHDRPLQESRRLTTINAQSLDSCGLAALRARNPAFLQGAAFERLLPVCCPRAARQERSGPASLLTSAAQCGLIPRRRARPRRVRRHRACGRYCACASRPSSG
jgi:hypothetical protein